MNMPNASSTQMNTRTASFTRKLLLATGIAATLFTSQQGSAASLGLAQSPLFVSEGAPANVFFLNDDSESMDWQMATSEDDGVMRLTAGGDTTKYNHLFPDSDNVDLVGTTEGDRRVLPDEDDIRGQSPMPPDFHGVWRGRFYGYNKIYYNPEVVYRPWQGVDDANVEYANAIPTAVRLDPYLSSGGSNLIDLNSTVSFLAEDVPETDGTPQDFTVTAFYRPRFYLWGNDTDGDGVIDSSAATNDPNSNGIPDSDEPHTRYEIRTSGSCTSGPPTTYCPANFKHTGARTDCSTVSGSNRICTAEEELKNFANWYQYFRRRELAAKNAIAAVVAPVGSEVRMGYGTLHKSTGSNFKIAAMNLGVTTGNKKLILDNLFTTQGAYGGSDNGSTPLRTKLYETGRYYECRSSGSIIGDASGSSCPWLAAPQGSCQQSFTILMTDGFYNDSFNSLPGSGSNEGQVDRDGNSPNTSGNTSFDGGAYADDFKHTLADVAMHYYERDLNSTLANNVPVIPGVDNASHQHMVTYGVGFGVVGTLTSDPPNPTTAFAWPNPTAGDAEKIDDLRHAAYNGRGKFMSAADPVALANSLKTSIDSIFATTGSASAVAVNSRTLTTGTTLYQARFTSLDWSGDLRAITLDESTGNVGGQVWSAGDVLKTQGSRQIITFRKKGAFGSCTGLGAGTEGGVAFSFGNLSQLQECLLDIHPVLLTDDNKANLRVDYLRGSTANEGAALGDFRIRTGGFKLGDIINSTPVFIGAPDPLPGPADPTHATFKTTYSTRGGMLYVGANDGMLHGFDADTGEEKIAFVPSQVYPNLSKLTDVTYRNLHRYFVDGSPTVADAFGNFANGCSSSACWRTVLAGGLAGGGKGIFALDVTDPDGIVPANNLSFVEANAANIALWEFVDSPDFTAGNNMGHVYGEVTIAKMNNGKWAAIFGNGYNSADENAALYIVDITTGTLMTGATPIVLNRYVTATGNSNGLSAPVVYDKDNDGDIDYIYAGDLRGNLWKIDVTSSDPTLWDSAHKSGGLEFPLFTAVDGAGLEQPITARPAVRVHPTTANTYLVYVGTGRYIADGDKNPAASPVQTMYGIWDENVNGAATPVARAQLLAQTITQTTLSGQTVRVVSSNPIDWTTHKGWRLDLRTAQVDSLGEMSVTNPVLATAAPERLIFTTLIPLQTACTYGGTSFLMEISPLSGGNLGVGVFDINNDGVVDAADMVGGSAVSGINPGIGILPEPVIVNKPGAQPLDLKLVSGSTGEVKALKNYLTPLPSGSGLGRRSWRQLK